MSDSEKMEGGHVMKEPEFKISKIKYYKEVVNKKEIVLVCRREVVIDVIREEKTGKECEGQGSQRVKYSTM